jgi:hypothetical protein
MNLKILSSYALAVAAGLCIGSAPAHAHGNEHSEKPKTQQHYGQAVALGGGTVRTYVELAKEKDDASNRKPPLEIGIEISGAAMKNLPADSQVLILDFPIQARDTPFQYMMFDWNPNGHEPVGIYDKPHFDFHFYIQDLDEVEAIAPGPCAGVDCEDYERAIKPVPAQFLPDGYIDVKSVVPFMGNHLIHPASPEYHGEPFTRTFLYGAYDGRITFYEPMITVDSIVNDQNRCTTLKLPQAYAETGYYPTKYCTQFDSEKDLYRVYIKDFVYRIAPR